jgi:hypothetical protein
LPTTLSESGAAERPVETITLAINPVKTQNHPFENLLFNIVADVMQLTDPGSSHFEGDR